MAKRKKPKPPRVKKHKRAKPGYAKRRYNKGIDQYGVPRGDGYAL